MFKIGKKDEFWYPVRVESPDENGKPRTETFDAQFRRYTREQFADVMERAGSGSMDDLALARDVLIGWRNVQDDDGGALAYSDDNREILLNVWPVLPAVVSAWIEAHSPKGRAKN